MKKWPSGSRISTGCGPATFSSAIVRHYERAGVIDASAAGVSRTRGRACTRALRERTPRSSTCARRWPFSTRTAARATRGCAGSCIGCANRRSTCRRGAPSSSPTSMRSSSWPTRSTATPGARTRRGGAAIARCAWPTGPRARAPRAAAWRSRSGWPTPACACTVWLLASALAMQGDMDAGKALTQQGLVEARALGLRANEESLLNTLIVIANMQGDVMGNLELSRQKRDINREMGDRRAEAIALLNLGVAWLKLGDLDQAQRYAQDGLRMLRANGDRVTEGSALCTLSDAALPASARSAPVRALAGRGARANACAIARSMPSKRGQAELALGRSADARATFAQIGTARPARSTAPGSTMRPPVSRRSRSPRATMRPRCARSRRSWAICRAAARWWAPSSRAWIELTCHRVLARLRVRWAPASGRRAHEGLEAQAATIPDATLRRRFLEDIPYHREIASTWAALQERPATATIEPCRAALQCEISRSAAGSPRGGSRGCTSPSHRPDGGWLPSPRPSSRGSRTRRATHSRTSPS